MTDWFSMTRKEGEIGLASTEDCMDGINEKTSWICKQEQRGLVGWLFCFMAYQHFWDI